MGPLGHFTAFDGRFVASFSQKSKRAEGNGSWLNLIQSFFAKMANTLLRAIRVTSEAELKTRIEMYLPL